MLASKDKETFFTHGWFVKPQLFDADEIRKIRDCFHGLETKAATLSETGDNSGSYFVLDTK
ncbi:MAG: hypothetical protein ACPG8D_09720, partial [Luminiphilus sp.]